MCFTNKKLNYAGESGYSTKNNDFIYFVVIKNV